MDARQRREVKLRWGDEGVASQQHLAPEPSLNGDLTSRVVRAVMRSMDGAEIPTCMLSFERSPSPHYGAAVRLARSLPGYEYRGEGRHERHSVPIGLSALPLAERLLALVQGWRSTVVTRWGGAGRTRDRVAAVDAALLPSPRAQWPRRTLLLGLAGARAGTRAVPVGRCRTAVDATGRVRAPDIAAAAASRSCAHHFRGPVPGVQSWSNVVSSRRTC